MTVEIIEVVVPASLQIIEVAVPDAIDMIEVASPGLQGPKGQTGHPGAQGPMGPAVDTSIIALDGGNF